MFKLDTMCSFSSTRWSDSPIILKRPLPLPSQLTSHWHHSRHSLAVARDPDVVTLSPHATPPCRVTHPVPDGDGFGGKDGEPAAGTALARGRLSAAHDRLDHARVPAEIQTHGS